MDFVTKTIPDFLSDEEIIQLERVFSKPSCNIITDNGPNNHAEYNSNYVFSTVSEDLKTVDDIIGTKLREVFHPELIVGPFHLHDSLRPYQLHSDAADPKETETLISDGLDYAWTFIIPLDTYDTHTIMFDQKSGKMKDMYDWIHTLNPPILDSIDKETYEKYLSHCDLSTVRCLSLHEIFPWNKGWLSATDRRRIHCSDNYIANGLNGKRALVAWSTIPKKYIS